MDQGRLGQLVEAEPEVTDRTWSNYPVGKVDREIVGIPEMPDAVRGSDPEFGPFWEQVTSVRHEYDRHSGWSRREVTLLRWYDRGVIETVRRETRGR